MTAQLSPTPVFKGWNNDGTPLAFGKLFTYIAGTTTKQASYTDYTQGTPNTNPVILNSRGEANVWLDPTKTYKLVLAPSTDTDPPTQGIWTVDQINGSLSPSASIIPSVDNAYNLGSTTNRWANVYAYQNYFLGATNIPLYNSTQGIFGYIAQTAAEIAASVTPTNYAYAPGDVRRYGGDPTGATDSTTAIQNAIASNTRVYLPGGNYKCATALNLASKVGCHLVGDGGLGISAVQSRITFSISGAGDCITATQSQGITIEDLMVIYTNAGYTGKLVNMIGTSGTPTNRNRVSRCSMGGVGGTGAAALIALDGALNSSVENSVFFGANVGILGQDSGGASFSNAIRVHGNDFSAMNNWSIRYLGAGWDIEGNTFEPLANGVASAIQTITAAASVGCNISGNWFGDGTLSSNAFLTLQGSVGFNIAGNDFSADGTHGVAIQLDACKGVAIHGNHAKLINTFISVTTTCTGISIKGNDASSGVTTVISSASLQNITTGDFTGNNPVITRQSLALPGYKVHPDGQIEMWGSGTTSGAGTLAVSFPTVPGMGAAGFPTALLSIYVQPFGTSNFLGSPSAITTTGFTANTFVANTGAATAANIYWRAMGN